MVHFPFVASSSPYRPSPLHPKSLFRPTFVLKSDFFIVAFQFLQKEEWLFAKRVHRVLYVSVS